MIGDTKQDVQAGINAGCKTVRLTSGDQRPQTKFADAKENIVTDNLLSAVKEILKEFA